MPMKNRPRGFDEQSKKFLSDGIEKHNFRAGKQKVISFVRNKTFSFINVIARTILLPVIQPRATPEKSGLPWARLFWPFRPFLFSQLIIIFL
jgi:hypothetical protein